ncbi:hypothetical protein PAXINDRAFT_101023 [Paxillus involutus ATCC 200175]|uniref:F-box domain-containing protein n=1 Tax=Paxillus involutus ATCC 200175 TaxID=664439 RepID=A0A0C9SUL2_PAXIN|nr:hypothetical protein PAXINDRAFT_101023 [Paxillus involutus ATCC 200175]
MACATSALEELDNRKMDFCRVLYITEILRNILDNLDKQSLFRITVTCRDFSGPALDTLWAVMDSFKPFIPLLPENVRQNWDLAYTLEDLSQMQCPEEEWKVFDSYARRVRHFDCGNNTNNRSVYQQLIILRPTSVAFPHLKGLSFTLGPGTLMFPPSLRILEICSLDFPFGPAFNIHLALRRAAEDVPFLGSLRIVGEFHLFPAGGYPLPFKALHTVELSAFLELQPKVFHHFSHLLSTAPVRFLRVAIPILSQLFVEPTDRDKMSIFLNVEVLDIIANPEQASNLVSLVGSPHLHTVIFEARGCSSGFDRFLSVLAQRPVPIRSLKITVQGVETRGAEASADVQGFLRALEPVVSAGLERLTVNISMERASRVCSSVWKRLDEGCWPALEHFECNLTDADTGDSVISVVQS